MFERSVWTEQRIECQMDIGEPIDQKALGRLLEVIGGDSEDLKELVDEFEQTTPDLIATMRMAAEKSDMTAIRIAAHSLKSNARDMGAMRLAELCEALEHAAREGAIDAPGDRVEVIETELTRTRGALAAISLTDG